MKKQTTISELLLGDTLGDLVKRLANKSGQECIGQEKLIVIMMGDNGSVTIATSGGTNRFESAGALQIAYDMVISSAG